MFFIVTFHQIVFYSLCFGRSWLLIHLMLKLIYVNVEYFTNFCIVSIHPMLKFINLPLLIWRQTANISIHPMLKLIDMQDNLRGQITEHFNTSHVKVNLQTLRFRWRSSRISIHPMLKLICSQILCNIHCEQISIHPMLKLILMVQLVFYRSLYFNTSHVKVNQKQRNLSI